MFKFDWCACENWFRLSELMRSIKSNGHEVVPAGVVESLEHDETLKKSWSSTAAREVSSRNGFTKPLGQDFFGRDSVIAPVQEH